jgi:hypothetical protein
MLGESTERTRREAAIPIPCQGKRRKKLSAFQKQFTDDGEETVHSMKFFRIKRLDKTV